MVIAACLFNNTNQKLLLGHEIFFPKIRILEY